MPLDVAILVATAVLAVVAVSAAVVAVRAARRIRPPEPDAVPVPAPSSGAKPPANGAISGRNRPADPDFAPLDGLGAGVPVPARLVEGRVVVVPTSEQVAVAALTRPSVRVSVLLRGVAHALRPESRDRIAALMRREYRDRRRTRLRAGRRAARAAHPQQSTSEHWLGELPAAPGSDS